MSITDAQKKDFLPLICSTAEQIGDMLKRDWVKLHKIKRFVAPKDPGKISHDAKTYADLEAEKQIREALDPTGFLIIGEEFGGDAALLQSNELYWSVDPLDGTLNYINRIPASAVSIGLMRGLSPVLGVVYDFNQAEMFWGARGLGAWVSQKRPFGYPPRALAIQDRPTTEMIAGFDKGSLRNRECLAFSKAHYLQARSLGSAALMGAYVSDARMGIFHFPAKIWDVAGAMGIASGLNLKMEITPLGGYNLAVTIHHRSANSEGPLLKEACPSLFDR